MADTDRTAATETDIASGPDLVTESLVEEVSIDGMCGVY
ncbi:mycofactocin precursor MftA [Williamsia deligens]|uniref:Mycofactocin MftA n=1 Tax=Williamsia deligens TaxID=321325 RepID=A0ABW3G234_9NOCA|nr:mycofactocin precursor MftA [Williamsia deligens]